MTKDSISEEYRASKSRVDGAEEVMRGAMGLFYLLKNLWWSSLDFPRFDTHRLHRTPDSADEAPSRLMDRSTIYIGF
jgi:hypothetical protein